MKTLMQILKCPDCGELLAGRFSIHRCFAPGKEVYVRRRNGDLQRGTIASKPVGNWVKVTLPAQTAYLSFPVTRRFLLKNVVEPQDAH